MRDIMDANDKELPKSEGFWGNLLVLLMLHDRVYDEG